MVRLPRNSREFPSRRATCLWLLSERERASTQNELKSKRDESKRRELHADDYDQRQNYNFLQGLGQGTANCFQPRMAAECGRLGRADDVFRRARVSRDRARPARARPL